jgi:hypothetical protein
MQRSDDKRRLLQTLQRMANQARSADAQLLKEFEKCPSSKTVCALFVSALSTSQSSVGGDELLLPEASWIHPFI